MPMKSFKQWTYEDVEDVFGIAPIMDHPILINWLNVAAKQKISALEKETITQLRNELRITINGLNEEELKFQFIAPFVRMTNFHTNKYRYFLGRKLIMPYKNETIEGRVDFMVARGKKTPKQPFFFLHEYKQDIPQSSTDPLGQLLVAMVAAQQLNEDKHTIYGAYVVGRLWYFVILADKEYSVSLAYDTTRDAIFEVFCILKQVKAYIEEWVTELENKNEN